MAFASDAGVYPHGQNSRQLASMVRYGMTPMQAVQASSRAAELLGWDEDGDSISPGHYADLVAVIGDLFADVRCLEHVEAVMKGRRLIQ